MNEFEINFKQIFFSFWKIRYYILLFPCIFVLLLLAYGFSQKVFPKNILVYYIQFNNTEEGNSYFMNDIRTLSIFKELEKKWGLNAFDLRDAFHIDAISPKTPFIQTRFQTKLSKPGLKPAEIDALGKQMVQDIENANRLSARISFDYQVFGLSVKQGIEILTSLPSLWNKTTAKSSFQDLYISPDLKLKISKIDNEKVKALETYDSMINAIKALEKIEATDKRSFLLTSSTGGYSGSGILVKIKLLKSIYVIPYFNSQVNISSSEILFFLNNLKMNKFEIEERLAGIDRTIASLKKVDANEEKIGVMTSNEINAEALKMLTDLKYNEVESEIYTDHIRQRSRLEKELAKTKREIDEIQKLNSDKSILTEDMYNQIFDTLDTYNIFINDYKKNFLAKDSDRYNPLVKPQLIGPKDVINQLNLIFALVFGVCIGIIYGFIILFINDFKSKTQINGQSKS